MNTKTEDPVDEQVTQIGRVFGTPVVVKGKTWLWVRDDEYAMIRKTDGTVTKLYDIRNDPTCAVNIAAEKPQIVDKMYQYMLADADGDIPVYPDPRAW